MDLGWAPMVMVMAMVTVYMVMDMASAMVMALEDFTMVKDHQMIFTIIH